MLPLVNLDTNEGVRSPVLCLGPGVGVIGDTVVGSAEIDVSRREGVEGPIVELFFLLLFSSLGRISEDEAAVATPIDDRP
jgi:hypothetical protein